MSASTERLVEQIRLTEETLALAKRDGNQLLVAQCETDLRVLRKSLVNANEALTEGKQVLKG
jgi:hypothetical protein